MEDAIVTPYPGVPSGDSDYTESLEHAAEREAQGTDPCVAASEYDDSQ